MVRVAGPSPGIESYVENYGPQSELDFGFAQAYMNGRNAINNGDYRDFLLEFIAGPGDTVSGPLIDGYKTVRYLDEDSDTIWAYFSGGSQAQEFEYRVSVPFAVVDLGDDFGSTADDVRLWPLMYDFYGDYRWYIEDYLAILDRNTGAGANMYGNDFFSYPPHDGNLDYWGFDPDDPISRHDWDYRMAWQGGTWSMGDSIIVFTNDLNTEEDVFRFNSIIEVVYICGDANGDGSVDIDDIVFLINYVFGGGPEPYPISVGDVNCSGNIDIDDIVYLINYVFGGGPEPCDPDDDGIPNCQPRLRML
jgi:hypothetical protein